MCSVNARPEVLLLCEYATLHGGEQSMLATLDSVRADGFSPVVATMPDGPLAEALRLRGVEVVPFECDAKNGVRPAQNVLREQLAAMLRQHRPTLLHANSLAMGRLSGPVARALGIPSLSHLRDIIRLSSQAAADLNCHRRLIAVSEATRAFHVAAGLDADRVHVVFNGVDLEMFCPRPPSGYLHRELHLPQDAILIGSVGQIGLRKGQDTLLKAARLLAAHHPNVHYLLVGQRSSQKEESRQYERDLHAMADARVHFLGVRTDMPMLLNEFTMLVHTARQEPLGRVFLESAASGCPVVATHVGGTPEIFPPNRNAAILTSSDAPEATAAAIEQLLDDPAGRDRIAAAARKRAEEAFDASRNVRHLLRHYHELIA